MYEKYVYYIKYYTISTDFWLSLSETFLPNQPMLKIISRTKLPSLFTCDKIIP